MRNIMKLLTVLSGGGVVDPLSVAGLQRYYIRPGSLIFTEEEGTGTVVADSEVGYWQDLSGNNEHGLQATSADRVLYRAADAQLGDSLDFVSSDFFSWTTTLALNDFSLFAVLTMDSLAAFMPIIGSSASNNNTIGVSNATTLTINGSGTSYGITLSVTLLTATKYVIDITRSGTGTNNITARINNVAAGAQSGNNQVAAVNQIGNRGNKASVWDGRIKALAIYNVALSDGQRSGIYTYLNALP